MISRIGSLALLLLATLPVASQDMSLDNVLIPGEGWRAVAHASGPIGSLALAKDGTLYVAVVNERAHSLITTHTTDSIKQINAAAIAPGPHGLLYLCQPSNKRLAAIDSEGHARWEVTDLVAQNLVVTADNAVYCTVAAEHALYAVSRHQTKRKVVEGIAASAGMTLLGDRGTLVVADSARPALWTFRIEQNGDLTCKERYFNLLNRRGLEPGEMKGLAADDSGRLYVTTSAGIQVFDPTGRLSGIFAGPAGTAVHALVFGGRDRDILYAACGDALYARKTRARGSALRE